MPSNPKVLPCGHQFCRQCIQDLKKYQDDRDVDACCPMCRGPLTRASAKKMWNEAKNHEIAAYDFYRMQQVEIRASSVHHLMVKSQREYRLAVKKLEECLEVLKMDQRVAANQPHTSRFSSPARRDAKNHHQQIKVLVKLIEIVPFGRYDNGDERTIQLLRTCLEQTKLPMPQLHLKLAKVLHRQLEDELVDETMDEYERVLQIAKGAKGRTASRHAKKLQGQAHYGLARCYHQLGNYQKACREYRTCERFHALQDYGLAAECHYAMGNYVRAMDYASMQLRRESTRQTIDTLLLMAKSCKAYFLSIRTYRGIDALEYQSRCETYRRCVRNALVLARHDLQHAECAEHVELLHHLMVPTHKQRTILPSYIVPSSEKEEDDDDDDDDNGRYHSSSYDNDLETTEQEPCDTEISVEL